MHNRWSGCPLVKQHSPYVHAYTQARCHDEKGCECASLQTALLESMIFSSCLNSRNLASSNGLICRQVTEIRSLTNDLSEMLLIEKHRRDELSFDPIIIGVLASMIRHVIG